MRRFNNGPATLTMYGTEQSTNVHLSRLVTNERCFGETMRRVAFEGGPLDGQSFELPPATTELRITSPSMGEERYRVVVDDRGVFARWIGITTENGNYPSSATTWRPLQAQ